MTAIRESCCAGLAEMNFFDSPISEVFYAVPPEILAMCTGVFSHVKHSEDPIKTPDRIKHKLFSVCERFTPSGHRSHDLSPPCLFYGFRLGNRLAVRRLVARKVGGFTVALYSIQFDLN